jgi:S-formylglutathione hydrolase FrmB
MGGYGAMRIGLGYPDRFCSITAHSGALMHGTRKWTRPGQEFERRIFGRLPAGTDHDLVHLAKKAKRDGKLPRIRIDCGTEDFLLEANRQCHSLLTHAGIAHEYEEFPGAHTWDYWDHHIQRALAFHAGHMRLKQGPAW